MDGFLLEVHLAAVGSRSFSAVRATVDLPQPLSPTSPTRLTLVDVEIDAIDGFDCPSFERRKSTVGPRQREVPEEPVAGWEMFLQVLHREQRFAAPVDLLAFPARLVASYP